MTQKRLLLGQLISNGDCLLATTVARQIKHDDPTCHLTWAISARCRTVLDGNPYVDEIWEWPSFSNLDAAAAWAAFESLARARLARDFDALFLTQFFPGNAARWNGTLRSSIFAGYPRPITVPVSPVLRLSDQEVQNVRRFAEAHGLQRQDGKDNFPNAHVVLFECANRSGQSFMSPSLGLMLSERLVTSFPQIRILMSSHVSGVVPPGAASQIIDASGLSFRENAELSHYCTMLIGCSSGLTWLCTSEWARRLPMIQFLSDGVPDPNSVTTDHVRFGLDTGGIIELFDCSLERAQACIACAIDRGFAQARAAFHESRPSPLRAYRFYFESTLGSGDLPGAMRLAYRHRRCIASNPFLLLWHFLVPVRVFLFRPAKRVLGMARRAFSCAIRGRPMSRGARG